MQIQSLGQEDTLEEGMATNSTILVVKNPPAKAGDLGLIPGSGRFPGGGNGNPFQYFCLGNPADRGAWWATVHRVAMSQTRLSTPAYAA